jgi:hypothetical protein
MLNQQVGMFLHKRVGGLYRRDKSFLGNWSERVLMALGMGIGVLRNGSSYLRLRSEIGGL